MNRATTLGLTLAALAIGAAASAQPAEPPTTADPAAAPQEPTAPATTPAPDDRWTFRWRDTFRLDSPDGDVRLRFGGRVQSDWAEISGDDGLEVALGGLDGGAEFRRADLYFEGLLHERIEFKAQYDFAGGAAELKDVYLGLVELPVVGGVRVGHFKEPWSLEEQTSSKYVTFLERALPVEAFSPSRNVGFMAHRDFERLTWAAGAFKEADDFGDAPETDEWAWTARVTGVPWTAGEDRLLHLGAAASLRDPAGGEARFRSRPESHLAPRFVDTGALSSDGVTLTGAEAALVLGPLSLQGEWSRAAVDRPGAAGADLDGFYAFASWFPTGESRPYDGGSFGRVRPRRPWGEGAGAWEVAARWSSVDLDERAITGGRLDDLTVGLNWYPYANVRWMLNYVRADRDGAGAADVVQMRFQVDF